MEIDWTDVVPSLKFLEERGFIQTFQVYDPQSFGNAVFELQGPPFDIRIVRDRSQIFIELRGKNSEWIEVIYFMMYFSRKMSGDGIQNSVIDVETSAIFLKKTWNEIANMLSDQKSLDVFKQYVAEKQAIFVNFLKAGLST